MASNRDLEARARSGVAGAVWLPLGAVLYNVAGWRGIILAAVYLVGDCLYCFYRACRPLEKAHGIHRPY